MPCFKSKKEVTLSVPKLEDKLSPSDKAVVESRNKERDSARPPSAGLASKLSHWKLDCRVKALCVPGLNPHVKGQKAPTKSWKRGVSLRRLPTSPNILSLLILTKRWDGNVSHHTREFSVMLLRFIILNFNKGFQKTFFSPKRRMAGCLGQHISA